jgi:hypothetical protein
VTLNVTAVTSMTLFRHAENMAYFGMVEEASNNGVVNIGPSRQVLSPATIG